LAGAAQGHFRESEADDGKVVIAGLEGGVLLGEEGNLLGLRLFSVVADELDGFAPGGFLASVEFAEVEDVALDDGAVCQALGFDDTPVEVLFAILEPCAAT
jgi:hypothetical protein